MQGPKGISAQGDPHHRNYIQLSFLLEYLPWWYGELIVCQELSKGGEVFLLGVLKREGLIEYQSLLVAFAGCDKDIGVYRHISQCLRCEILGDRFF
jgi:hypothetical protein